MQEILKQSYLLQKMPEKGGWTFITISELTALARKKHGMHTLQATLDGFQLPKVSLMPMKSGNLFMPINASIRKSIGKEAGQWVELVLYSTTPEQEKLNAQEMLLLCLADEPLAKTHFLSYTMPEQEAFIHWIDSAGSDQVQVNRLAKSIDLLLHKQKLK